jgi:hypothetical protein
MDRKLKVYRCSRSKTTPPSKATWEVVRSYRPPSKCAICPHTSSLTELTNRWCALYENYRRNVFPLRKHENRKAQRKQCTVLALPVTSGSTFPGCSPQSDRDRSVDRQKWGQMFKIHTCACSLMQPLLGHFHSCQSPSSCAATSSRKWSDVHSFHSFFLFFCFL